MLDRETEKYYNNFFDLFQTEGWKQLIKDIDDNILSINNIVSTKDTEDLWLRKGQLQVLTHLKSFEDAVKLAYEELTWSPDSDE